MTNVTYPAVAANLAFDDEFTSFVSSPDGSTGWMTRYPYGGRAAYNEAGNGEAQFYGSATITDLANPFTCANSVLTITASQNTSGGGYGLPYVSGLITTHNSFWMLYGYVEISCQIPAGAGLWPAFWMLDWDDLGKINSTSATYGMEFDIFEFLDQSPTTLYVHTHDTTVSPTVSEALTLTVPDASAQFHAYGMDWAPDYLTFFLDGVQVGQIPTPVHAVNPMAMLVNLAVGGKGSWAGPPNAQTVFPAAYQVDYVRAYRTAATAVVGGTCAIITHNSSIQGKALQFGAPGDPPWGAGLPGTTVTLSLNGSVVSTLTVIETNGWFMFRNLAPGSYVVTYGPPAGWVVRPGTSLTDTVAVTAGENVVAPLGEMVQS